MARRNMYDSYRGKNTGQTILKIIALILALTIVLGVVILVFFGQHIAISSDGIRFDFPSKVETPEETPIPSFEIIIPEDSPAPTIQNLSALPLDLTAFIGSAVSAEAFLSTWEGNAFIVDMKPDSGLLSYVSQAPTATTARTNGANQNMNRALEELLSDSDLYAIARVSVFRDNTAPYQRNSLALRIPGGNWRDAENHRWLDPSNKDVQNYIIDICTELAQMGFDEILLDNASFPVTEYWGNIQLGTPYTSASLTETITSFYGELSDVMSDYPLVKLSFTAEDFLFEEATPYFTGQTLENLALHADRIWFSEKSSFQDDFFRDFSGDFVIFGTELDMEYPNCAVLTK